MYYPLAPTDVAGHVLDEVSPEPGALLLCVQHGQAAPRHLHSGGCSSSSQRAAYIAECLRLLEGDGAVEGEGVAALPNLIVNG